MKKLLVILALTVVSGVTYAQEGALVFNNRVGSVNAPVSRPDGTGAGAGQTAELFLVSLNGASKNLVLTPNTDFRTSSAAATFFVNGKDLTIAGSAPGASANLMMRVFSTSLGSYDAAVAANAGGNTTPGLFFGQSAPFTITLGGGANPPSNLDGLTGFSLAAIPVVPEPSTIALGLLGAAALLIRRRK